MSLKRRVAQLELRLAERRPPEDHGRLLKEMQEKLAAMRLRMGPIEVPDGDPVPELKARMRERLDADEKRRVEAENRRNASRGPKFF